MIGKNTNFLSFGDFYVFVSCRLYDSNYDLIDLLLSGKWSQYTDTSGQGHNDSLISDFISCRLALVHLMVHGNLKSEVERNYAVER